MSRTTLGLIIRYISPGKSYSTINLEINGWKTGEMYLRLITTELSVAVCETLKTDRKLDVTAAHDVLDFELRKLGIKPKLLDDARILARRQARIVFTLCTSHDHLSRGENECGCLWITNPHNDSGETLCIWQTSSTRARDA